MIKLISKKNFYLFVTILSIITLVGAVYIEYILNAKPCKLCIYQRFPYLVAIFLCFIGYYNLNSKIWLYLLCITFLVSMIISSYHTGIENGFFPEFKGCSNDGSNIIDKQQLLDNLSRNLTNCKDVNFRVFGLSLATINILISSAIVFICSIVIKNEKN